MPRETATPEGASSELVAAGALIVPVRATSVNVATFTFTESWAHESRPMETVDAIETDTEPTVVHETPSVDREAVILLPTRTSRTHVGENVAAVPLTLIELPPVLVR